jgi:hypothetical protein
MQRQVARGEPADLTKWFICGTLFKVILENVMTQRHPRIQVSLDPIVRSSIAFLAEQRHQSLSNVASDLIEKALELEEDLYFSQLGERRIKELKQSTVSHDDAWK